MYCCLLLFITGVCHSQINNSAAYVLPKIAIGVNDFEDVLTENQEEELTEMMLNYEKVTSNEIAFVSVSSLGPYENIDDFALKLAQKNGLGKLQKNNGIIIVLSKTLRVFRIQNGEGIGDKLTDAETGLIIEETIIPNFKSGKYFEGIRDGIIRIKKELE